MNSPKTLKEQRRNGAFQMDESQLEDQNGDGKIEKMDEHLLIVILLLMPIFLESPSLK